MFLFIGMLLMFAVITNAQNIATRAVKLTPVISKSATFSKLNDASSTNVVIPAKRCLTAEAYEAIMKNDPTYAAQREQFIAEAEAWAKNNPNYDSKTTYTIPIVVHIIYKTAAENISDTRVTEQINATNADYAGTNAHSMHNFASSLKANANISFCLAKRDPSGNTTTGITRTQTTKTSFNITGSAANSTGYPERSSTTGGCNAWDVTKYFNVWVCNAGSSLCGISLFPTSPISNFYGTTINYPYFGLTGATAPFNLGGTFSHESGHCLNLYHIWGDDGSACTGSDQVSDTPGAQGNNYGNVEDGSLAEYDASGNVISTATVNTTTKVETDNCTTASPGVMYENFMDYTDDKDYANFTPGQVSRMVATLAGADASLTTSNGCTPVGSVTAPVADFSASATNITTGTTVTFTDLSTNTPTSWSWVLTPSTGFTWATGNATSQNPHITFNTAGSYTVALTATNTAGSNTKTKTAYIIVNTATAGCDTLMPPSYTGTCLDSLTLYVPDAVTPLDSGVITGQCAYKFPALGMKYAGVANSTISDVFVMYADKIGTTGNTSVSIYNDNGSGLPATTALGTSATIVKSAIDTTNSGINFHNKYHFTTAVSSTSDVYVIVNIPNTFTNGTNELAIWSNNIACSTGSDPYGGYLKYGTTWYSFTSAFGINLDMAIFPVFCTTVGEENIVSDKDIVVYPNPAQNNFTVLFTGYQNKGIVVNVYNLVGELVKTVAVDDLANPVSVDMANEPSGVYFVNVKTPNGIVVKKLSLIK